MKNDKGIVAVTCSTCGDSIWASGRNQTRNIALEEGWERAIDGNFICPKCLAPVVAAPTPAAGKEEK